MPKGQELTAFSQTIAFAVALCSSRLGIRYDSRQNEYGARFRVRIFYAGVISYRKSDNEYSGRRVSYTAGRSHIAALGLATRKRPRIASNFAIRIAARS